MRTMKLQLLVSTVGEDVQSVAERMNIRTDALIVNQCDRFDYLEYEYRNHRIRCFSMKERGVGLSRNTALMHADGDVLLFSDEDLVYQDDYEQKVLTAFRQHPEAQVITFNFQVDERRRTYYNETGHRVRWYNYGRYPAYAIAVRKDAIRKANVTYSLLYGGGAKYSNGEDSLFLHDCLKKGLYIYADTALLGQEIYRESTWFSGYHEKFFRDRGVLYHDLYGCMSRLFSLRFLWSNRKKMLTDIDFHTAYGLMKKGIREGKQR